MFLLIGKIINNKRLKKNYLRKSLNNKNLLLHKLKNF